MNISDLLKNLNNKQREVVSAQSTNLLVLAGAGSGKTRVLAHRIAWLLLVEHYSPYSIMAVTFTNKAAAEMRHRIKQLIGSGQNSMWIGTFHSLSYRLLRTHYMDAGLPKDFQILDTEDQLRLLERLMKTMNLDIKQWSPHQAMCYINEKKNKGLRPKHIESHGDLIEQTWFHIYQGYQQTCDRAGLVDFSELLLRTNELWMTKPHILNHYRKRFTNIMIDEFQDTNNIQYIWIHSLAGNYSRVMIVGDDDQSIYGWRGAKTENIQRFLHDFRNVQTIRLEQNYRSTNNILKAANALISHNKDRFGKKLWTDSIHGEPISIYCAFNELDEVRFVINRIKTWKTDGGNLNDCAILYRSNAQSRTFEEALLQASIPYQIYGGMRFFERQEIKDALAYLRLIANRNDDAAFERVINTPTRGVGDYTLNVIRQASRNLQLTLWQTSCVLLQKKELNGRATAALKKFTELIDYLDRETDKLPLYDQTELVIKKSGLWLMYSQEKGEKGRARIENFKELVNSTRRYNQDTVEDIIPLQEFLSNILLENGETKKENYQDAVQLMTMHASKGLEFSQVFIVGMEEGTFPSHVAMDKNNKLEEERRLAYVAITRAMKKLTLTYTEVRRIYGKKIYRHPSRFISELPEECIDEKCLRFNISRFINDQNKYKPIMKNFSNFEIGQRVRHDKFGEGTIINLQGWGHHIRLQVAFQERNIKWLMAIHTHLELV